MHYALKRRLPLGRPGPDFSTFKSDDATTRLGGLDPGAILD
jgi:hypothetical protein